MFLLTMMLHNFFNKFSLLVLRCIDLNLEVKLNKGTFSQFFLGDRSVLKEFLKFLYFISIILASQRNLVRYFKSYQTPFPNFNPSIQTYIINHHFLIIILICILESWRHHQIELNELHGRLETQGAMIAEQVQRLQNADILVKDLYVENSHLTASVQRLEQQRVRANMIQQQQQQQRQNCSVLPGMP